MSDGSTIIASPTVDERALIDFLRDRDIACPLCGYNLRHLRSPRCPECGRELELRVGLSEPRQAAWLTAQIAVSAAAGVGVLVVIMWIVQGWPTGNQWQALQDVGFIYDIAAIAVAAALLYWRRRYLRLGRATQWIGAAVAMATTLAGIVAIVIGSM